MPQNQTQTNQDFAQWKMEQDFNKWKADKDPGPSNREVLSMDDESRRVNVEKLTAIRKRAKDPVQIERIDRLIDKYESYHFGSPKSAGKGLIAGAVNMPMEGANILASVGKHIAGPLSMAVPGAGVAGRFASDMSDLLSEGTAATRVGLGLTDSRDLGALGGEIVGGVVAGAKPYGRAAQEAGKVISKVVPKLAPYISGSAAAGKGRIAGAAVGGAGNVITGLPLTATQAIAVDGTMRDKIVASAKQMGADFLFGAVHGGVRRPRPIGDLEVAPDGIKPVGETPAPTASSDLADQFKARQIEADAARVAAKQVRELAKAEWILDNKDKLWKDLGGKEKQAVVKAYIEKQQAIQATKTPQVPAPQVPAPEPTPSWRSQEHRDEILIAGHDELPIEERILPTWSEEERNAARIAERAAPGYKRPLWLPPELDRPPTATQTHEAVPAVPKRTFESIDAELEAARAQLLKMKNTGSPVRAMLEQRIARLTDEQLGMIEKELPSVPLVEQGAPVDAAPVDAAPVEATSAIMSEGTFGVRPFVFPEALGKASPRYGYGSKLFKLSFESDLDRAAYILQGKTKSAAHDKILAAVKEQTGLTDAQIMAHGQNVKYFIKSLGRIKPAGELEIKAVESPELNSDISAPIVVDHNPGTSRSFPDMSAYKDPSLPGPSVTTDGNFVKVAYRNSNGEVIGYLTGHKIGDNRLDVKEVNVNPNFRRRGIATKMYEAVKAATSVQSFTNSSLEQSVEGKALVKNLKTKGIYDAPLKITPEVKNLAEGFNPKLVKASPSKLSHEQLPLQIQHVSDRLDEAKNANDPETIKAYQKRLTQLMNEKALRDDPRPSRPITAQIPGFVGGAFAGALTGIGTVDKDDDVRAQLNHIFLLTLAGSAGGSFLQHGGSYLARVRELRKNSGEMFPGEIVLRKNSKLDVTSNAKTLREIITDAIGVVKGTFRQLYIQTFNKAYGAQALAQAFPQLHNAPAQNNFAKLFATAGRWIAGTENALAGDGVEVIGKDGNPRILHGPYNQILDMVKGDVDGLDRVRIALASAEGALTGRKVPMDQPTREAYIRNAPPEYIAAAKATRKYNLALMQLLLDAGRISPEGFAAMAKEEWYAPLLQAAKDVSSPKYRRLRYVGQEKVLHAREGGGDEAIVSPTQVDMEMTARIMRSVEFGKSINAFLDFVETQPKAMQQELWKPKDRVSAPNHDKLIQASKDLSRDLGLSGSDAANLLAYLDTQNISAPDGIVTVYRNGELTSGRVRADLFASIQALSPSQWEFTSQAVGKITQFASRGVVYDPWFVGSQFIMDHTMTFLFSKYGENPLTDGIRAIGAAMFRTKEYRELLAVGGPASWQSLQFANPKFVASSVKTAGSNAFEIAAKQVKELDLVSAYKTMILPFAESSRVAESLAARRHGASALEGAYAAWDIQGNTRMEGASTFIHNIHQMAMFSRPSMSAMDKALKESGMHPYLVPEYAHTWTGQKMQQMGVPARLAAFTQVVTRGTVGIVLPTIGIWNLYKDDDQIRALRQTPLGARYWFLRNPITHSIFRIKKPHIFGEILGTAIEKALDYAHTHDSQRTSEIVEALMQDISFNLMPLPLQIYMGLKTNQDPFTGNAIVPRGDELMPPALAGQDRASPIGQAVANRFGPWTEQSTNKFVRTLGSPAGIDYLLGSAGGMLGQDALRALTAARQWITDNQMPPKEELPIISRVFVKYPSMSVASIGQFYDRAQKIEEAAHTLDYYAQHDPGMVGKYIEANRVNLNLVGIYNTVKQEIADLRRAIEDVKTFSMDADSRRKIIDNYTELMIQRAKMANSVAKRLEEP